LGGFQFDPTTDIIKAPANPALWPEFRRQLAVWRGQQRRKLNYSDALYQQSDFSWVAGSYACGFLMLGDQQIVPSVTRVFFSQQPLYILFQVYQPRSDPVSHHPDVAVTLLFFKDGKKYTETPTYPITRYADEEGRILDCYFTVPLAKFERGVYVLQANIVDRPAQSYTFRRISFAVR